MTKEMRPSHRIDILSSALAYYGMKMKDKLGNCLYYYVFDLVWLCIASLLLIRWDRALKCKSLAEETLRALIPSFFLGTMIIIFLLI